MRYKYKGRYIVYNVQVPNGDEISIVDHAVRVRVPIGDEEMEDDVDEESELAGDVEEEEILRQTSEEAELQGSEEG